MNQYSNYKPSNIDWIGDIPAHWEVRKVSRSFNTIGSGTTPKTGNEEYYTDGVINWINTGDLNDSLLTDCNKKITEEALSEHSTLKIYPVNTLLIAMYGATIGKVSITGIEGCTNQACCALGDSEFFLQEFVFYWFIASRTDIINLSYGGGQPNISQEIVRFLKIPCPPLAEQVAIATYLDEQTAQLDGLIARKRRLMALLREEKAALINEAVTKGIRPNVPTKPSGIDWLGDVPAHWEVKKLKYVVEKVGSGVTPSGGASVYQTSGIPLLRSQNIHFDGLRLDDVAYISEEIEATMSNSRLQSGDILLNITGASIGRCFYVPQNFGLGNVNQHVCIVRPSYSNITTNFLYLLLRSDVGQLQIDLLQNGANREGLNFEQLKNFVLPLPTLSEQAEVVTYLDAETAKIDFTVGRIEREIELMQEYRTALISEVVTGKVKVV